MIVDFDFRFTGRNLRPGPTSTRWTVALAKRTVEGDIVLAGVRRGDAGGESRRGVNGVRGGEREGGFSERGGVCCCSEELEGEGRGERRAALRVGLWGCSPGPGGSRKRGVRRALPSGLETRRMDLGTMVEFGGGGDLMDTC